VRLSDLIVMQQELRYPECLPQMIDHVKDGGLWDRAYLSSFAKANNLRQSPLIQISRFPDGLLFLHDGHHRSVASFLGGRKEYYPEEYQIKNWTYDQYSSINFDIGFVTPFDPRTQVRKADLASFKKKIKTLAAENQEYAREIVWLASKGLCEARDIYWEPRKIKTIAELAGIYHG
jgi:hypothetical protein